MVTYVRAGRRSLEDVLPVLDALAALPIELYASRPLMEPALQLAVELQLSGYDAFYAVLAEQLDMPLATADRNLAAAVVSAVLVD